MEKKRDLPKGKFNQHLSVYTLLKKGRNCRKNQCFLFFLFFFQEREKRIEIFTIFAANFDSKTRMRSFVSSILL